MKTLAEVTDAKGSCRTSMIVSTFWPTEAPFEGLRLMQTVDAQKIRRSGLYRKVKSTFNSDVARSTSTSEFLHEVSLPLSKLPVVNLAT